MNPQFPKLNSHCPEKNKTKQNKTRRPVFPPPQFVLHKDVHEEVSQCMESLLNHSDFVSSHLAEFIAAD